MVRHNSCRPFLLSMRDLAVRAFTAAVAAVNPLDCITRSLRITRSSLSLYGSDVSIPLDDSTPLYLISFGKAAAAMAHGAEQILGSRLKEGIAIVPKEEQTSHLLKSLVFEAGRSNLPDVRSIEATKEIGDFGDDETCREMPKTDENSFDAFCCFHSQVHSLVTNVTRMVHCAESNAVFLVLISGGGSALLCLPSKGVSLQHKLTTIRVLVSMGASIQQLNAVRRALSQVKGGRLLDRMGGRKSLSLVLSDIVGDPLEFIASGPTVHPQSSIRGSTVINALKARSNLPKEVIDAIDGEKTSPIAAPSGALHAIIGNNSNALEAAKMLLDTEGYSTEIKTCIRVGDAQEFGREIVDTVVELANEKKKGEKKCILYGGETTVNLPPNNGIGGRNQHAALTTMVHLSRRRDEWKDIHFSLLFAGTDGQDGPTDAAGVIVTSKEIMDLSPEEMEGAERALIEADSYNFWREFRGGICHFQPGLTGTNVMDITIIIYDYI